MAMSAGSSGGVNSDINVTPMIDVLLVLLIIFMIVIALGRTAIDIQIPPLDTGVRNSTPSTQIVLELRDDGGYYINGESVAKDGLEARIKQIFEPRPAKVIFLKPGQNRIYGDIMEAIDIARGAGVELVGFIPIEAN